MDPTRAFLFYLPDNGTTKPPPISSPSWGLNDGGAWKTKTPFPVYAVSSEMGTQLMHQLSLYSGNMTGVPYGHEISEMSGIDPRDYVRLYSQIDLSNASSWPGLWAFILVIVGVLVFMLGITSATMHLIQRSRRNSLRRRVARGEVNLEALGIKRLTVPQEFVEKLPMFTYSCQSTTSSPIPSWPKKSQNTTIAERQESGGGSSNANDTSNSQENTVTPISIPPIVGDSTTTQSSDPPHKFLPYSQPTCAICLDDFVSGVTPIRELPCGHIFHPECIDPFLGNNSSLCPMCKKSVLPAGYYPTNITNAMVRRERNLRALRSRVTIPDEEGSENSHTSRSRFRTFSSGIRRIILPSSAPPREMENAVPLQPQLVLMTSAVPAEVNPHASILGNEVSENLSPSLSRQEIAQRRIEELTSRQTFVEEMEAMDTRQQPKCKYLFMCSRMGLKVSAGRSTLARVFPGFT
jgi:hypothetical protein